MKYRIGAMLFAVLALLGATTAFGGPASAAAEPTLYCQLIGNTTGSTGGSTPGSCGTFRADSSYVVDFAVRDGFNFYRWTPPTGYRIVAGCNLSTPFCDVVVRADSVEHVLTATVATDNADVVLVTTSATATTPQVCGKFLC